MHIQVGHRKEMREKEELEGGGEGGWGGRCCWLITEHWRIHSEWELTEQTGEDYYCAVESSLEKCDVTRFSHGVVSNSFNIIWIFHMFSCNTTCYFFNKLAIEIPGILFSIAW